MGTSGGCSGDVHLTVTRIAIPATSEDSGDWVREYVHKWDFHPSSCYIILLHIYNLDSCYWCSHTIRLILTIKFSSSALLLQPNPQLFLKSWREFLFYQLFLCFFSIELVWNTLTKCCAFYQCLSNSSNERNKFLDVLLYMVDHNSESLYFFPFSYLL